VRALVSGGAGFLLAVLWFDLMFDVQARGHGGSELPDEVRRSIAAYYRRVTTDARPMNRLVATAMVVTIGSVIAEIAAGGAPAWAAWASLVLVVSAVGVAAARTVPSAVRLGAGEGGPVEQSTLARAVLRDHCFCLGAIAAVLVVQALSFA
jgi:hypothetical protein